MIQKSIQQLTQHNTQEDQKLLQEDLYRLENWSNLWLLKFNKDKCKHLHLGKKVDLTYRLLGQEIQKVSEEKDLGIYIDSQLNFKLHIDFKIKKANQMLGLIKRSFNYMDKEMFLVLYKSLIRPHLEYLVNTL